MLKFDKVTKFFGDQPALDSVSFEITKGEFAFLTGPSGSGKTTTIRLILKDTEPDEGEIVVDDKDISGLKRKDIPGYRQKIGVVYQDYKLIPEKTIAENVEIALAVIGLPQKEWRSRVEHVLKLVEIGEKINMFPAQLSGGELQRAALARALVVNPDLILADEPTGNLDWETSMNIMELFEKINKEGKTILMATHHKQIIDKMGKRVVRLDKAKPENHDKSEKEEKKGKKDD
jgi:cell division transport system ATP-binding protein